jgi:hypothetical protein
MTPSPNTVASFFSPFLLLHFPKSFILSTLALMSFFIKLASNYSHRLISYAGVQLLR